MRQIYFASILFVLFACGNDKNGIFLSKQTTQPSTIRNTSAYKKDSWQYFLQHLPVTDGSVLNYKGKPIDHQSKSAGIINYDIGKRDLQQCADALIRLRSEYLFQQKRYNEIGFHFTNGDFYSWKDYSKGKRPEVKGNKVKFYQTNSSELSYKNLRSYLDIIYAYAGTISIANELKDAEDFSVGTIIITPGSPGHCCIIVDEAVSDKNEKFYKLVEGFTPAQSIYIVSNPYDKEISPWYQLQKDNISTSSYQFRNYLLKKFE